MNRYLYGALVVLATFLMGSSFSVGRIGLDYASPLLLAGMRFTLAGLLMAPFVRRMPLPRKLSGWAKLAAVGLFQTTGVMGCIFLSMRTIPSGETSILTFVNPLLVVVLGSALLGRKYRLAQWLGVLTGAAGVFIALGGFRMHAAEGTWLGLGAALFWAAATLLAKAWGTEFNSWVLTAGQMLFGGVLLLALSLLAEPVRLNLNPASIVVLLYLVFMGSIVQFAAWYYVLSRSPDPGKTSSFLFLAPLFGVLSGRFILGEAIQPALYAGGACILAGIFLANRSGLRQRSAAGAGEGASLAAEKGNNL
ncbi:MULTISPECIES: DMT family transporter [unclassified Paenibacillus]|uniref:DMT family transporter n=1 Tax=unclassified Paenibacillus TaxID=185978 RepID=UPI000956689F|nr:MULTISPECIES: DMT family transporter [unclassified Paenibacillus]ASS67795.1 EamA family transporter [Paenibacillus sp. RUD330]SIR60536.1 Threonine/homoserine efflux transporter RhtA [Paenibacillus sp. RU4X]SIR69347.1 Threonine/homoserine efflux transporter RhtA [Paenibacillus sp. RU4T]